MIKTKTVETVEEYDENGKLVRKTTTEIEETDDSPTPYKHTISPCGYRDSGFIYNAGPSCSDEAERIDYVL